MARKKKIVSRILGRDKRAKAKPAVATDQPTTSEPATSSKNSVIDDIFAKKPSPEAVADTETEQPTIAPAKTDTGKKAKKNKKKKAVAEDKPAKPTPDAAAAVVVFEEPTGAESRRDEQARKRKRASQDEVAKTNGSTNDADDMFADTRGSKSSRYTEDGLPIYEAKALRIGEGGDTDLCPFDCECCF